MKYNVGDKVRIKNDFIVYRKYSGIVFLDLMKKFHGYIATITECVPESDFLPEYYHIDIDNSQFMWSDSMFEETLYKIGDKVLVRSDLVEYNVWYSQYGTACKNVVASKMMRLKGQVVTIDVIDNDYYWYKSKEAGRYLDWTDEMFSGLVPEVGDLVKIKPLEDCKKLTNGLDGIYPSKWKDFKDKLYIVENSDGINRTAILEDIPYVFNWYMIDVVKKASPLVDGNCEAAINTRSHLQSGMMGETIDNRIFVIVGDKALYEDGGFELVGDLEANYSTIKRLVKECYSFNMYKDGQGEVIYEAPKKMTKEQIEKELGYLIEIVENRPDNNEINKQVEKAWKGKWTSMTDDDGYTWFECSRCEYGLDSLEQPGHFCPTCGAAMTDEAVKIVTERLEELKDGDVG